MRRCQAPRPLRRTSRPCLRYHHFHYHHDLRHGLRHRRSQIQCRWHLGTVVLCRPSGDCQQVRQEPKCADTVSVY